MVAASSLRALGTSALLFGSGAYAAFGYTKSGSNYVIDAGSADSLVVTVVGSSCDVSSIKFKGTELQAKGGRTQIGSGLGSASVSVASATSGNDKFVKVTCKTSTLTHYIIVKEGEANLYMGTYITAEPAIGELRYLARLNANVLPYEYPFGECSDTAGATSTIEGSDVFMVDGQSRSKFYSSNRFMDMDAYCAYGTGSNPMHACFVAIDMETSSGGPFFRDINSNRAATDTVNLSWYMNSGHVKTEAWRVGLNGPYVLAFTTDKVPKSADYDTSFFADMNISGYVPKSARGTVTGKATGVSSPFTPVVHWYNKDAQYWAKPSADGTFTSPAMKPGTYTMVLYQTEYQVATSTVTVSAGKATAHNIASNYTAPANSLFKIGEFDGQPFEMLNGDKFLRMHPSDKRMASWTPSSFVVGTSKPSDFPMALFKSVNSPATIEFNLDSAPGAATFHISTTLSANGGRPEVTVNGWTAAWPPAPVKIDSRGVTRGAYRGYGEQYNLAIPAGKLVKGSNKITIGVLSGSSGTTFLSPSFIVDAMELYTEGSTSQAKEAKPKEAATTSSVVEQAPAPTKASETAAVTSSAAVSSAPASSALTTAPQAVIETSTPVSALVSTLVTKTKSACKAKRTKNATA
ncbi:hypothetical protein TD95_002576 [Thielaviopsis punctulata]|uniref:rhamnogalacturonan endolyase n=1 Tax=Thielaviopsis punctulata TaxID=72032 RepID=A0A0F4ZD57_9PEZI|nr:hypothetical protein TD95_002576 [Thielaviopsis punctulata]